MKTVPIVGFFLLLASCEYNDVVPEMGFIQGRVNGEVVTYRVAPDETEVMNYIKPGAFNITFLKERGKKQLWGIDVYHWQVNMDISRLPMPFIIKGPNQDFSGKSPEFHTMILDPSGAPYGLNLAAGSTFDHDMTVEITSVQGDVVRGRFYGTGFGVFEDVVFSARLPRRDW